MVRRETSLFSLQLVCPRSRYLLLVNSDSRRDLPISRYVLNVLLFNGTANCLFLSFVYGMRTRDVPMGGVGVSRPQPPPQPPPPPPPTPPPPPNPPPSMSANFKKVGHAAETLSKLGSFTKCQHLIHLFC